MNEKISTFDDALKKLGIEEYKERIFNSNSHGELFHIDQYITIANGWKDGEEAKQVFQSFFKGMVEHAKYHWKRPESVFQHVSTILLDNLK